MNTWLLVRLKSDWADKNIAPKLSAGYRDWLTFRPKHVSAHKHQDLLIFAAQAADYFGLGRPVSHDSATYLVFDGAPRPANFLPANQCAARSLANFLARSTPDSIYSIIHGEYSLGACNVNSRILYAFSDFSGIRPIYYLESADLIAVSNSLYLLNPVCTRHAAPTFQPLNAASLVSQGNMFGTHAVLDGVRLLPPGMILRAGDGGIEIRRGPDPFYGETDEPSAADFDRASDLLISNIDWLSETSVVADGPLELSLTGGEDSRLVLALARQSALSSRIKAFTYGDETSPDVVVARQVAGRAGIDHERKPMGGGGESGQFDRYWSQMRAQAFRFAAHHGAVDGAGATKTSAVKSDVTGIGDHFYKRIRESNAKVELRNIEELRDHLTSFQAPHNSLSLLTQDADRCYRGHIDAFIDEAFDKGATLNDAPELYYVENRATWWTGVLQAATVHRQRLFPLLDRFAARVGVAQKLEDRRARRFIFEIMRRIAPELLAIPLVNKVYHPAYAHKHPELAIPDKPFQAQSAPEGRPGARPWTVQVVKDGHQRLKSHLMDNPRSPIFEIVDRSTLEVVLSNPDRIANQAAVKALLNLAQLQMLFYQDWSTNKDDITDFKPQYPFLETNIAAFSAPLSLGAAVQTSRQILRLHFPLPEGRMRAIRLDPMDRPGSMRLFAVSLQTADGVVLARARPERMQVSPDVSKEICEDGTVSLTALGDDPQCRFPDLEALGPFDIRQATRLVVDRDGGPDESYVEAFFDMGSGFSREYMGRIALAAATVVTNLG